MDDEDYEEEERDSIYAESMAYDIERDAKMLVSDATGNVEVW